MDEIRRQRQLRGLSRVRLAVLSDMDPTTLWRYETGRRSPTVAALEKLAATLGVEAVDLMAPKAKE